MLLQKNYAQYEAGASARSRGKEKMRIPDTETSRRFAGASPCTRVRRKMREEFTLSEVEGPY
jgi:hypothetical protein